MISWELAALAAAAVLVGFSKTAVSGANTVSLAIFAAVLPARESTGVLLPVLIVGDVVAVLIYRRHAHRPTLLRLFPAVAAGVVAGTLFMFWADDDAVRTSIGAILLLMAGATVWRRRPGADEALASQEGRRGRLKARSYGVLGGFTTMVANAGGPVQRWSNGACWRTPPRNTTNCWTRLPARDEEAVREVMARHLGHVRGLWAKTSGCGGLSPAAVDRCP
ncbi:sulfite exporter TauE/SafE family protein [Streptomyces sp. NPDC019443]|uniref:sulfite exporter TauE/SafE family protein n=1 Tax=Streptomyces sp. NPDC019443 TaxID=3365061 RepID=UPI00379397A3